MLDSPGCAIRQSFDWFDRGAPRRHLRTDFRLRWFADVSANCAFVCPQCIERYTDAARQSDANTSTIDRSATPTNLTTTSRTQHGEVAG